MLLKHTLALCILSSLIPTRTARNIKFTNTYFGKLHYAFKRHKIIPDVLWQAPRELLTISFKNKSLPIRFGDLLLKSDAKHPPVVEFKKLVLSWYTLIVQNIDARPIYKDHQYNWQPYIVVNIPGRRMRGNNGQVLSPYRVPDAPLPQQRTRMVFFVFEQHNYTSFDPVRDLQFTNDFNIMKFSVKFNLCNPVYGSFVYIQETDNYNDSMKLRYSRTFIFPT